MVHGIHSTDAIFNSFSAFAKFCIDKKEIPYFMYDYEKINRFFYNMKKEYPKEFKMVSFDTNGGYPFSKTISEAKNDMLTCGYLYSLTPRFNPHLISKNALEWFEEIKNKRTCLNVAEKLYDKFGCNQNGTIGKHKEFKSLEDIH